MAQHSSQLSLGSPFATSFCMEVEPNCGNTKLLLLLLAAAVCRHPSSLKSNSQTVKLHVDIFFSVYFTLPYYNDFSCQMLLPVWRGVCAIFQPDWNKSSQCLLACECFCLCSYLCVFVGVYVCVIRSHLAWPAFYLFMKFSCSFAGEPIDIFVHLLQNCSVHKKIYIYVYLLYARASQPLVRLIYIKSPPIPLSSFNRSNCHSE